MMKLGEIRETAAGSIWLTKRTDLGAYAVMVFTTKARGWFTQFSGSLKECRARADELLKGMAEEETASAEDQEDSKKAQELNEKIEKVENHLEWIYKLFHEEDPKRLIDEAFGFIQGVEFFNEELYEEINKRDIWTDFHIKCINEKRGAQ